MIKFHNDGNNYGRYWFGVFFHLKIMKFFEIWYLGIGAYIFYPSFYNLFSISHAKNINR